MIGSSFLNTVLVNGSAHRRIVLLQTNKTTKFYIQPKTLLISISRGSSWSRKFLKKKSLHKFWNQTLPVLCALYCVIGSVVMFIVPSIIHILSSTLLILLLWFYTLLVKMYTQSGMGSVYTNGWIQNENWLLYACYWIEMISLENIST